MGILTLTGTGATATAASQAKYEAINACALIVKVRVDEIRAMANFTDVKLLDMPGKDTRRFILFRADTGVFGFQFFETIQGNSYSGDLAIASLPANGSEVVLYIDRTGTTLNCSVGTPDGAVILSSTITTGPLPTGVTGAGSGVITIPSSSPAPGLRIDALAVLNAARTGNARFAKPLTTDGDVVGVHYFDETSGSTAADSEGGTALTLSGGATLSAGGTWDFSAPPPSDGFPQFYVSQLAAAGII